MYYSALKKTDIANGVGIRVSLFVSGCDMHCKGCFNPETWDFKNGEPFTPSTMRQLLAALDHDHIDGLSILGGEPLHLHNINTVKTIIRIVRENYPEKSIWVYTGYKWETVKDWITGVDVLVDGAFIEDQKDLKLQFRGSSNQRIIDVKKSLAAGEVVLWEDLDRTVPQQDLLEYVRGCHDEVTE